MTKCSKCYSGDIMASMRVAAPPYGTGQFVEITEPRTAGLQFLSSEDAEINVVICGNCGYAEHYVDKYGQLWRCWQKGSR